MAGLERMPAWMRLAWRAETMDSMPPTCTMATSFSGTSPKWRNAMRAPTSMEVPKRVMPKALPRSCSGFSISGRAIKFWTRVSSVVPTIMTSAPPNAALTVGMVGVPYRLTILRMELICPGDRCQSKACSKQWRRVFQSITTNFHYEGKIYAAEGEQVDRTLFEPAVKSTGETAAVWDIYE